MKRNSNIENRIQQYRHRNSLYRAAFDIVLDSKVPSSQKGWGCTIRWKCGGISYWKASVLWMFSFCLCVCALSLLAVLLQKICLLQVSQTGRSPSASERTSKSAKTRHKKQVPLCHAVSSYVRLYVFTGRNLGQRFSTLELDLVLSCKLSLTI